MVFLLSFLVGWDRLIVISSVTDVGLLLFLPQIFVKLLSRSTG